MNLTRGKIVLSVCVLLAISTACGRPTPGGGEPSPVSATEPPATTPAQVEHTAAPAVEHATAPAPGEHGTPAPGKPLPTPTEKQPATASAPGEHGTPTPGETTPGGRATQPPSTSSGVCANPYFPVKLGARWVYNFSGRVGFEEEITAVRADGFTMRRKQGDLIRLLEWTCRPEGLVALSYDGGPAAEAISVNSGKSAQFTTTDVTGVTLPANPAPGMTWTQAYDVTVTAPGASRSVSGKMSLTYSAVAIESITVPAGTFEALKVEVQKTVQAPPGFFGPAGSVVQSAATIWLAPRVGVIKEVTNRGSVTELAVYTPGAP